MPGVVGVSRHRLEHGGVGVARDEWRSSTGQRVRLACWDRDRKANAPCWLCGGPIDYSLGPYAPGKSTECWEPDHRRPRDRYPELTLEPSNIMPSHAHCNRSRGDKAGLSNIGKTTRSWFG